MAGMFVVVNECPKDDGEQLQLTQTALEIGQEAKRTARPVWESIKWADFVTSAAWITL